MKKTLPKILLGVVLACALFLVFLYANNDIPGSFVSSLPLIRGIFFVHSGHAVLTHHAAALRQIPAADYAGVLLFV